MFYRILTSTVTYITEQTLENMESTFLYNRETEKFNQALYTSILQ